jgi:predicted component of type VI protein secretion system
VPNEYLVYLSPRDRERLSEYEDALVAELAGYLLEHARRERLAMLSRPMIEFRTDERLRLGEFGIQTRVTHPESDQERLPDEPEPAAEAAAPQAAAPEPVPEQRPPGPPPAPAPSMQPPEGGRTMVYSSAERVAEPLQESAQVRAQKAILVVDGKRLMVGDRGATVGRSRQCEIVVEDPNVSRRHGELRPRGGSWVFTDLGSTNGSRVNGRPVEGPTVVRPGDEIELGTAVMRFELQ